MAHNKPEFQHKLRKMSYEDLIALINLLISFLKIESRDGHAYRIAEGVVEHGFAGDRLRGSRLGRMSQSQSVGRHTKRRGPPKGKVPPQLRPYLFKKGHRPVKRKHGNPY